MASLVLGRKFGWPPRPVLRLDTGALHSLHNWRLPIGDCRLPIGPAIARAWPAPARTKSARRPSEGAARATNTRRVAPNPRRRRSRTHLGAHASSRLTDRVP